MVVSRVDCPSAYSSDLTVAFLLSFQVICEDQIQEMWPIINLREAKTCVSMGSICFLLQGKQLGLLTDQLITCSTLSM